MRLHSLEVWHWRGLDHVLLDGLTEGLNVVEGPNEAGKSRLFQALHWCLFQRFKGRGQAVRALQSHSRAGMPEVSVCFETDGKRWTMRKRFLKGEFARLEGPGGPWLGEEAEEQLRELLGTRGRRGQSKMEDQGLFPLLWLKQHESRMAPHQHMNEDGRLRLRELLLHELGEAAAGPVGQHVIARAEFAAALYWTPKSGKAKGDFKLLPQQLQDAELGVQDAVARQDEVANAVSELAAAQVAYAPADAEVRRLRDIRSREDERFRDNADVEARAGAAVARLQGLNERRQLLQERLGAADARRARHDELGRTVEALTGRFAQTQGELAGFERTLAGASAATEASRHAERAAEEAQRRSVKQARRTELKGQCQVLADSLRAARAAQSKVDRLSKRCGQLAVGPNELRELSELELLATRADARLQAASTVLEFTPDTDVVVDGDVIAKGTTKRWSLQEQAVLRLDGVGELLVQPGGEGLIELVTQARDGRQALAKRLDMLGHRTMSAARSAHDERLVLERQLEDLRRTTESLAPEGFEALAAQLDKAEADIRGLGADDRSAPTLDDAATELAAARVRRERARAENEVAAATVARSREQLAGINGELQTRRREHAKLGNQLALSPPDEAQRAELDLVGARIQEATLAVAQTKGQAGEGAGNRELIAKLSAQHDAAFEARRRHERTIAAREAFIEARAADDLHGVLQDAMAHRDRLATKLQRETRRADAAQRLVDVLATAKRELQERLLEPVMAHVQPHIQTLFTGSNLDMDDEWRVLGLRSADRREAFTELSGGAQEQVSVLVRVGLAEVLAGSGRLPLVLDDALVNTDPQRRARMVRVLQGVTGRLQILLFTSQPTDLPPGTKRFELPAQR